MTYFLKHALKHALPLFVPILVSGLTPTASLHAAEPAIMTQPSGPAASTPQAPPADYLLSLTRSTLAALNQANLTGNYSVLHQMGSAGFRQNNPPQRLTGIFTAFRENQIDLTPTAVLLPTYTVAPHIRDGKLRLIGRFPSQPMQVNFDLTFEPEAGRWRLFGLAVNLDQVTRK